MPMLACLWSLSAFWIFCLALDLKVRIERLTNAGGDGHESHRRRLGVRRPCACACPFLATPAGEWKFKSLRVTEGEKYSAFWSWFCTVFQTHIPLQIGGLVVASCFGTPVRFPFFKSRVSRKQFFPFFTCLMFTLPSSFLDSSKATPDKRGCAATRRSKCSRKPIV